jgi:hypothetical protein
MKFFYFLPIVFIITLSGCAPSHVPVSAIQSVPIDAPHTLRPLDNSDAELIAYNIKGGTIPVGIGSPREWNLPVEIAPAQFKNAYRLYENVFFGLALQPNSNVYLEGDDGKQFSGPINFVGVVFSRNNGQTWHKVFEIKNDVSDSGGPVHRNPVGIFWHENKYYLDIADDRGAGSGEGSLVRYWTLDGKIWNRYPKCYYFNPDTYYNRDPFTRPADARGGFDPIKDDTENDPFTLQEISCPEYLK